MNRVRKILIISPYFPPSNLASVHRARLFAQHLPSFGWDPTILMVDERFYEEKLDTNLLSLVPSGLSVFKARAFKITKPRLIGDVGLRGFFQLFKAAKKIIREKKIDFVYIPIPSYYTALLGRWLKSATGVKYGIDYIDPWVHDFPGSEQKFSRHWWSTRLANVMEPYALKYASLITGVAEGYYSSVFDRNPHLKSSIVAGAMPYGAEAEDHHKVRELALQPYLFQINKQKIQFVYAGALLPKAIEPLRIVFQTIRDRPDIFNNVEFHFIGTGRLVNDPNSHKIKPVAEEFGLWEKTVFEYAQRIPYLDVLCHLEAASGIFVLGSTEPHYTPSKVYQGILSQKPVLSVLHYASTAYKVIIDSGAGVCCRIDPENMQKLSGDFIHCFQEYKLFLEKFNPSDVNHEQFDQYSAREVTKKLAELLDQALVS